MDIDKNEHIEKLLKHFFEGATSNKDEQILYDFFAGDDVPEHLIRYKQIFAYFDIGIKEEFHVIRTKAPVRRMQSKKWLLWSGIAASLLAFIFLNPFVKKPFDPYEGSYIIRNGVRITDINIIRPELEATLQQVLQQQEEMEDMLTMLMESENRFVDPEKQIRDYYNTMLEEFTNEDIRNEIKNIFEIE